MVEDSARQRIENAPVVMALGAGLGVLIALAAVGLLVWMEGRTINTAVGLEQGAAVAFTIAPDRVDPTNDGKLVHLTGEASTGDAVADPDFGITARAVRLAREVELYQWKESRSESKKDGKAVVTYTYTRVWSKDRPQKKFAEPDGHVNPAEKPYADAATDAAVVTVGAFTLTPAQVARVPADQPLPVTEDTLAQLPEGVRGRASVDPEGRLFVSARPGGTADAPQVGDVRVRFKVAPLQPLTLVARQSGETFEPYPTPNGEKVDLLKPGEHGAAVLFAAAQSSNLLLNWFVRVVSLALLTLGVFLVFRRMVIVASGLAPQGVSFEMAVGLFAAGMALPVVLVVIGLRWLLHHPTFGGGLFIVGAGAIGALVLLARAQRSGPFAGLFGGGRTWSPGEREALRRTALEPENAQHRLALASAMEKAGDPMGEFIRIDHELELLPDDDRARPARDARWSALLQEHGRTWFAPLRKLRLEPQLAGTFFPALWMHHGIIDEVLVDLPGVLPERADELFAAAPGLRVLEFHNSRMEPGLGGWKETTYAPDVAAIMALPQLKQIGVLRMRSLRLTVDDLRAITTSPNLANLTELDLSYNGFGSEGGEWVAQSPTLKRLRVLELRACDLGAEGAAALAGSANLTGLLTLNLGGNAVGPRGAQALAGSGHLALLRSLALDDNGLGPNGAKALADSPHLRQLTALDLGRNGIGGGGAAALSRSANLAGVTTLKLSDNKLGTVGARFLAASAHLSGLEVLELDSNEIDAEGTAALAAGSGMGRLKELSLSYNAIGDAGAQTLAAWPGLARLKRLSLRQNKIGADGVRALAASPYLRGLEELTLSNNEVGLVGAAALANSDVLANLKDLWVQEAQLTAEGENLLRKRFGAVVHLDA